MLDHVDGDFALDMLPDLEPVTYLVRAPAGQPDAADTFTAYALYSVFRRPATRADLLAAGMAVSDEAAVFQVWQRDLDAAVAYQAQPYVSYALADQSFGSLTGTLANTSAVVTGVASTAGLLPGMAVAGTGVPAGAQVRSVDSATQVTLTQAATQSLTTRLAFGWLWVIESVERHQSRARWDLTCRKGR